MPTPPARSGRPLMSRPIAALLGLVAIAVAVVVAVSAVSQSQASAAHPAARSSTGPARSAAGAPPAPADLAFREITTVPATPVRDWHASSSPARTLRRALPAVQTKHAPKKKPVAARPGKSLEAYRGLGSWVDIFDDAAWNDPALVVRDMARHGVRTLFVETGNSSAASAVNKPAVLQTFISQAHAHGMRVVAWYLPDMRSPGMDYARIKAAVGLHTADGQRFDSFALDIESSAVQPVSARNRALQALSARIRSLVGRTYALGAIIPSPGALTKSTSSWSAFPYSMLARTYNVFVPMSYYTYHGSGAAAAYADTISNVRVLRAQKGCAKTPIHLIGGISQDSSPAEVQAFVRAARQTGSVGAGLYGWAGTSAAQWRFLGTLGR